MTDFGLDVSTRPDLDPTFTWASGVVVVAQAVARRLETPAGSLPWDPACGFDLREYVADDLSDGDVLRVAALTRAEVLKEERVLDARVTMKQSLLDQTLTAIIALQLADAVFTLTLSIDAVSAQVLEVAT